jgi:hypothetical protein
LDALGGGKNPAPVIQAIENMLLPSVVVLDFDSDCAKQFGQLRGQLLQQGISVSPMDLLIAAVGARFERRCGCGDGRGQRGETDG